MTIQASSTTSYDQMPKVQGNLSAEIIKQNAPGVNDIQPCSCRPKTDLIYLPNEVGNQICDMVKTLLDQALGQLFSFLEKIIGGMQTPPINPSKKKSGGFFSKIFSKVGDFFSDGIGKGIGDVLGKIF
ncbi:hypothetical protein JNK13_08840 [bacterium]|nr:hypothetical protein [bacterium]